MMPTTTPATAPQIAHFFALSAAGLRLGVAALPLSRTNGPPNGTGPGLRW